MASEIIRTYTAGDTLPTLVRTAPSSVGDLTGFTVRLRIFRPDGVTRVKTITTTPSADGEIDDPTNRGFFISFIATDLIGGNAQRAEIEYDDGSGGITTEGDIFFDVADALG